MKEKMLREKGGAKVYIIVIVILVVLCAAVGIFAVVNMNKDKEDDEKTSKKNETNTSKSTDEDEEDDDKKENKDKDKDDDKDGLVKYTGELDVSKMEGMEAFENTTWNMSVEGNDDMISKLTMEIDMGEYLKSVYDAAGGSETGYTYEEYLKEVKKGFDSEMGTLGSEFTSGLGISEDDISVEVNWVEDEVIEIEIDLSKVEKSEYDIEDDESLIDYVVEYMEDEGMKMTKE